MPTKPAERPYNILSEMFAAKPSKQAAAIGFSIQRRAAAEKKGKK